MVRVDTVLSLLLGCFFLFMGLVKIFPTINLELYTELRKEFGRYNKVFPFYEYTRWRPLAKNYRLTVAIVEAIGGFVLIFVPGRVKDLSSLVLLCIMGGACYTHYALKDSFDKIAPCLVFSLLIICRLTTLYQVTRREKAEKDTIEKVIKNVKAESSTHSDKDAPRSIDTSSSKKTLDKKTE